MGQRACNLQYFINHGKTENACDRGGFKLTSCLFMGIKKVDLLTYSTRRIPHFTEAKGTQLAQHWKGWQDREGKRDMRKRTPMLHTVPSKREKSKNLRRVIVSICKYLKDKILDPSSASNTNL